MSAQTWISQRFTPHHLDGVPKCCLTDNVVAGPGAGSMIEVTVALGTRRQGSESTEARAKSSTVGRKIGLKLDRPSRSPGRKVPVEELNAVLLTEHSYWSPEHEATTNSRSRMTSKTELGRRVQVGLVGSGAGGRTPSPSETIMAWAVLPVEEEPKPVGPTFVEVQDMREKRCASSVGQQLPRGDRGNGAAYEISASVSEQCKDKCGSAPDCTHFTQAPSGHCLLYHKCPGTRDYGNGSQGARTFKKVVHSATGAINPQFAASCELSSHNDWSCVATIIVNRSWYSPDMSANPVGVAATLTTASAKPSTRAGAVVFHSFQPFTPPRGIAGRDPQYMLTELPYTTLYPGTEFKIRVYVISDRPLASARFQVEVDPVGLQIVDLEMGAERPDKPWTPTLGRRIETQAVVSATRDNQQLAEHLPGADRTELLCTLTVRVRTSAPAGAYKFTAAILADADADGVPMISAAPASIATAFVNWRDGINDGDPGAGFVFVADSVVPAGIFAIVPESNILTNFAVLDGKQISTDVAIIRFLKSGSLPKRLHGQLAATLKCSSDPTVLTFRQDCSGVVLTGTETSGGAAMLRFTYGRFMANAVIYIYYPQLPGRIRIDAPQADNTNSTAVVLLHRLEGWLDPARSDSSVPSKSIRCPRGPSTPMISRYQHFETQVFVTFRLNETVANAEPEDSSFEVDVTAALHNRFVVTDNRTSIRMEMLSTSADVEKLVVRGVSPGKSKLCVKPHLWTSSKELIACRFVEVTDVAVAATSLYAVPANRFSAELSNIVEHEVHTSATLCTTPVGAPEVKLTKEGEHTEIFTLAEFSDGSLIELSTHDGVTITSLSESIRIDDNKFGVVKTNPENLERQPLALVCWNPSCEFTEGRPSQGWCTNALWAVIPTPADSAYITPRSIVADAKLRGNPPLVTRPENSAEAAGIPSSLYLDVTLKYPTYSKTATSDPRTKIVFDAQGEMRFSIDRSNGKIVLRVIPGAPVGQGKVFVTFAHEPQVSASASFLVVVYDRFELSISPEPRFKDDSDHDASQLRPIAGTSPLTYEQSTLTCAMILSNTERLSLNGLSEPVVISAKSARRNVDQTVVKILRSARSDQALAAGVSPGDVIADCSFAHNTTEGTEESVQIKVYDCADGCACLQAFTGFTVEQPSRQGGALSASRALRGIPGDLARSVVEVVLSDGRRYQEMTPFETWLPGLLRFKSSTALAATISEETGRVELRGNSESTITFTVTNTRKEGRCDIAAVPRTTSIASNLDPIVGDMDLGAVPGIALPRRNNQDQPFEVDMWINTGEKLLGVFDFQLQFTAGSLVLGGTICVARGSVECPEEAAVVVLDPALRSPCANVAVTAEVEGMLRVIGVCSEKGAVSCGSDGKVQPGCNVHKVKAHRSIHLGKVRFRRAPGNELGDSSELSGNILRLGSARSSQPIRTGAASYSSVAGQLVQTFTGGRRARRSRTRLARAQPPDQCSGRSNQSKSNALVPGDLDAGLYSRADGDFGVVDAYDADCLLKFLVLKGECTLLHRKIMDYTRSGVSKVEYDNAAEADIVQWNDQCCFLSNKIAVATSASGRYQVRLQGMPNSSCPDTTLEEKEIGSTCSSLVRLPSGQCPTVWRKTSDIYRLVGSGDGVELAHWEQEADVDWSDTVNEEDARYLLGAVAGLRVLLTRRRGNFATEQSPAAEMPQTEVFSSSGPYNHQFPTVDGENQCQFQVSVKFFVPPSQDDGGIPTRLFCASRASGLNRGRINTTSFLLRGLDGNVWGNCAPHLQLSNGSLQSSHTSISDVFRAFWIVQKGPRRPSSSPSSPLRTGQAMTNGTYEANFLGESMIVDGEAEYPSTTLGHLQEMQLLRATQQRLPCGVVTGIELEFGLNLYAAADPLAEPDLFTSVVAVSRQIAMGTSVATASYMPPNTQQIRPQLTASILNAHSTWQLTDSELAVEGATDGGSADMVSLDTQTI